MTEGEVQVTFMDDPQAPEIFASGVSGLFLTGQNVAITLESARVNHGTVPGPINRVVVGRIVLPIAAAQNLVTFLNGFLEQHGASPSQAIVGEQTRQ